MVGAHTRTTVLFVRACTNLYDEESSIQHVKITQQPTHRRDIRTRSTQRKCKQQTAARPLLYEYILAPVKLQTTRTRKNEESIRSYVGSRIAVRGYQYGRNYNDRVDFTILHKRPSHSMPYWSNTRTLSSFLFFVSFSLIDLRLSCVCVVIDTTLGGNRQSEYLVSPGVSSETYAPAWTWHIVD